MLAGLLHCYPGKVLHIEHGKGIVGPSWWYINLITTSVSILVYLQGPGGGPVVAATRAGTTLDCSPLLRLIVGQNIVIDGGQHHSLF